jgi:hypothetical protein
MFRLLLKLIVAALLANATWHAFNVYSPHYRFKDGTQYAAQFRGDSSDDVLRDKILSLAAQFDVPVTEDEVAVSHVGQHTFVEVNYVTSIELLPGFKRPWPLAFKVDVLTLNTPKPNDSPK